MILNIADNEKKVLYICAIKLAERGLSANFVELSFQINFCIFLYIQGA